MLSDALTGGLRNACYSIAMESTSARDLDRRLADLVRSERLLAVQFVVELARFGKRELYRELGYTSLFYYCVRQLGLSKSSAFRRSEVARLIARFPVIADRLAGGRLSIRALVELRDVLTEDNQAEVLARADGKSREEAQLLAVEYRPKPIPRDVVRALPMPAAPLVAFAVVPAGPREPDRRLRRPRSLSRSHRISAASTSRCRQSSWLSWSKYAPRSLTNAPTETSRTSSARPSSSSSTGIESARR
jgi:hypothetical protein